MAPISVLEEAWLSVACPGVLRSSLPFGDENHPSALGDAQCHGQDGAATPQFAPAPSLWTGRCMGGAGVPGCNRVGAVTPSTHSQ